MVLKLDNILRDLIDHNMRGYSLLGTLKLDILYDHVKKTLDIPGDIAEVGTYRGGSAMLLSLADDLKTIHVFDTFEGLPEPDLDIEPHKKGNFTSSYEDVCEYLAPRSNIIIYKGLFPETAQPIVDKKFSLVHLDMDLYRGTLDALKFFYPRLSKGGVIICDDYCFPNCPGVDLALNEYFQDMPGKVKRTDKRCNQAVITK
jgi:hypothetical protein